MKNDKNKRSKDGIESTGLNGVKNALKLLKKHLPLFKKNLPLELNCFNKIHSEISKHKNSELFSKKIFRRAISRHTGSVDYLENCLIEGYRYNIELEKTSEISEEEFIYFEDKLKETKIRVAEYHDEFMKKKNEENLKKKKKKKPDVITTIIKKKRKLEIPSEDKPVVKKFGFK